MDIEAGGNLTVGNLGRAHRRREPDRHGRFDHVPAAGVAIGATRFSGNLVLSGDVKANGHSTTDGNVVTIQGCDVQIPSGAVLDITGDVDSTIMVEARKSLTIGGQPARPPPTSSNSRRALSVSLTGSFTPAKSAGANCAASGGRSRRTAVSAAPALRGGQHARGLPVRVPVVRRQRDPVPGNVRARRRRDALPVVDPVLRRALPAPQLRGPEPVHRQRMRSRRRLHVLAQDERHLVRGRRPSATASRPVRTATA